MPVLRIERKPVFLKAAQLRAGEIFKTTEKNYYLKLYSGATNLSPPFMYIEEEAVLNCIEFQRVHPRGILELESED